MGLSLFCQQPDGSVPRAVTLRLACDQDHGLLPAPTAEFLCSPWYPAAHHAAIEAGWKILAKVSCPEHRRAGP